MERVSQNMLFDNFVRYLNQSTTKLQELSQQASSQKKVNRPSDNPVGMARILNYRDSINALQKYQGNISTSKGWLGLADETLLQTQDILTRIKELTVQAANGTLSRENRLSIAQEVRQSFDQLVALANTSYEGKSIFSGHKTDEVAYEKGIQVFSEEKDVTPFIKTIQGQTDETFTVRFSDEDDSLGTTFEEAIVGKHTIDYRYSTDGQTWNTGPLSLASDAAPPRLDLGDVQVELDKGLGVVLDGRQIEETGGNMLGDGNVIANLTGELNQEIQIEFHNSPDLNSDHTLRYAYRTEEMDNFSSVQSVTIENQEAKIELPDNVMLTLRPDPAGDGVIDSDEELTLHPATELQIAPTAIYQGDTQNKPGVKMHGDFGVHVEPLEGSFDSNIEVELVEWADDLDDENAHNELAYRYRLPGQEWSDTEEVFVDDDSSDVSWPVTLDLPGGKAYLSDVGMSDISDINLSDVNVRFSLLGTHVEQIDQSDTVHSYATGDFNRNVLVELTSDADLTSSDAMLYRYSIDGGQTWETGQTTIQGSDAYTSLPVSGGMLNIAPTGLNADLDDGDRFLIQPRTAGISSEISEDVHLDMNHVGTEIFGGHYQNEDGLEPAFEEEETRNMFLGVGRLIYALERNDQDAINRSLAYVDGAMEQIGRKQAEIGARQNRLEISEKVLTNLELNQKERKSYIEDVDFAELMSELTQQQTVYQAVLKSSSMIMRMSLVNYL